ncbi:hypothetical protein GQ44DRAFT_772332 [Phaeosphaeriaceae sp. PMI808]|nr:hypothetical protein GQ44DRAFT_772332 [Phaeosphaeriaceae sp. PMI808]
MSSTNFKFSPVYESFAVYPELAKFRTHLELWCPHLYDQCYDIETQLAKCNGLVADILGKGREGICVTDFLRTDIREEHPKVREEWDKLTSLLRLHSNDLLTTHALANMPKSRDFFARHLADIPELFQGGVYGPTQEPADIYSRVPSDPSTFSLRGYDEDDYFTAFVFKYLKPLNAWYHEWILQKPTDLESGSSQFIELRTIQTVVNLITACFALSLLCGSLVVLSCVGSEKMRILVLGAFGSFAKIAGAGALYGHSARSVRYGPTAIVYNDD